MAIALNGEWASHGTTGASQNILASHSPLTGDLIVVIFTSNLGVASVVDSVGAIYTAGPIFGPTGGSRNPSIYTYYSPNASNSARTITVTIPSNGQITASALHIGGLATVTPFDKSTGATGNSGALDSGNAAATTFANEMLIGVGCIDGTTSTVWTQGAGYIQDGNASQASAGTSPPLIVETQIVSVTGVYKATASSTQSIQWACGILTFADTPVSGGGVNPGFLMHRRNVLYFI